MFGMGGFQLLPFYDAVGRARAAAPPDQRRALRRLRRRRLCPRHQPARRLRRDARARARPISSPAWWKPQRRHADGRLHRRHQPRAFLEEHDPGGRQVDILRPPVKEVIRVELTRAFPSWCAAPSRSRPRAGPARSLLDVPEDIATASTISTPSDFVDRPGDARTLRRAACRPDARRRRARRAR